MTNFEGVFPIVITPFREDGSVDFDSQRRVVHFLMDSGAHGLGLLANASEGYTLSTHEREELTKVIIKEVDGQIPVIVSTGHTGTALAVQLSRQAEEFGADGVMVLPPYYLKPDAEGVFQYYRAISEAISIPIMVQDAPLMTQVSMSPTLLARMGRELDHVRYVKVEAPPTAPKVSEVVAQSEGALAVFGGLNGHFLIEELGRGARGTMPGSDLVEGLVRIWDFYKAGRRQEARSDFNRLLPLIRYELQPGLGVSVMKHNLKALGIIASACVRHPTKSLDIEGLREVEELRADLSLPHPQRVTESEDKSAESLRSSKGNSTATQTP